MNNQHFPPHNKGNALVISAHEAVLQVLELAEEAATTEEVMATEETTDDYLDITMAQMSLSSSSGYLTKLASCQNQRKKQQEPH